MILVLESHYRSRAWVKALMHTNIPFTILSILSGERLFYKYINLPNERVLPLYGEKKIDNKKMDYDFLLDQCYELTGCTWDNIVQQDRRLRLLSFSDTIDYLSKIIYFVTTKDFSNVKIVVGEITWAHEIFLQLYFERKNIGVYQPMVSKLEKNTFFFLRGVQREIIFQRRLPDLTINPQNISDSLSNPAFAPQMSDKLAKRNTLNSDLLRSGWYLISQYLMGSTSKYIHRNFLFVVGEKLVKIYRRIRVSRSSIFSYSVPPTSKFVIVPLHFSPEAQIDVVGKRYRDQIGMIKEIAKNLEGSEWKVLVKEHPSALGQRSENFYYEIKRIVGPVSLLHPNFSLSQVSKKRCVVISVASFMSVEASFLGIGSINLVNTYYSSLCTQVGWQLGEITPVNLDGLIAKAASDGERIRRQNELKRCVSCLFRGSIWGIEKDNLQYEAINISRLSQSFKELYDASFAE